MYVGIYGVVSLLLKLVGCNLVHETYAAAFLLKVDYGSTAFLVYHLHCLVELLSAVTAHTAEDISGHAAGVHAYHNGFVLVPIALDEGYVLQAVALLAEGYDAEVSPLGRQVCLDAFLDKGFLLEAICNEVADGDNLETMLLGNLLELWQACHGAVLVENLDECRCRLESGEACQIDGCLGMSGTLEYTTVLCIEWIDMSGTAEVTGLAAWVCKGTDCGGTVMCADTGGAAFEQVDGHGEWCAEHAGVDLYLVFQL